MIDANDSRWIIKVGVGGLVRAATMLVHVDQWSGPERVDFSYTLDGDPVVGNGSDMAVAPPRGDRSNHESTRRGRRTGSTVVGGDVQASSAATGEDLCRKAEGRDRESGR